MVVKPLPGESTAAMIDRFTRQTRSTGVLDEIMMSYLLPKDKVRYMMQKKRKRANANK